MKPSTLLKAALILVLLVGLLLLFWIPVTAIPRITSLDTQVALFFVRGGNAYSVHPKGLAILYAMGVLGLWICAELLVMLNTMRQNPFIARNARALLRIGWVAMAVTALAFWAGYRWRDSLMSLGACAMLILGLFAMTLSQLFGQAVRYKEENDLTI